MKTSIATVSISGDLREKLAAIAAAGFDGVEIFENDFLAFDGSPADVGRMVRDHGLEISLFQPFRDFEGMPPSHRQRTFDRAEPTFRTAIYPDYKAHRPPPPTTCSCRSPSSRRRSSRCASPSCRWPASRPTT